MKKRKASVSVTALMTASILMIITLALIELNFFFLQSAQGDMERNRAKWFLEGRIQEYFDGVLSGRTTVTVGKTTLQEEIEGHIQKMDLDITRNDKGFYQLKASLRWKAMYLVKQSLEFYRVNLFDYVLVLNGDAQASLKTRMNLDGRMLARGRLTARSETSDGQVALHADSRIDYLSDAPELEGFVFEHNRSAFMAFSNSVITQDTRTPLTSLYRKNKGLDALKFPDFETIWYTFYQHRDDNWVITSGGYYDTRWVINPLSSIKELLAFGNGFSTEFDFSGKRTDRVYVMRTGSTRRYQSIFSTDYIYYMGKSARSLYYETNSRTLSLRASQKPVFMEKNDEYMRTFGEFHLSSKDSSMMSIDEFLEDVYVNSITPAGHMIPGLDYEYYPGRKTFKILNQKFYRDYVYILRPRNMNRTEFEFSTYPGRSIQYLRYFVDNEPAQNFRVDRGIVTFSEPVGRESRVAAINPPTLFFKKQPPGDETGVFIDYSEQAVIIDFNKIQNYPANGVFMTTTPVIVRGSPQYPVSIISRGNIYLNNVNVSNVQAPLMAVSQSGVWVLRRATDPAPTMKRTVIYSPLKALYTVLENGELQDVPPSLQGSLVLTMENDKGTMNFDFAPVNLKTDPDLNTDFMRAPLSYFPLPFYIRQLKRN